MALLDLGRSRVARRSRALGPVNRANAADERQSTWWSVALEIAGAFLVLMGITPGILALRFVLVLTHGVGH
jgi:hypothetical protein